VGSRKELLLAEQGCRKKQRVPVIIAAPQKLVSTGLGCRKQQRVPVIIAAQLYRSW
jgi:hypothetical protein